MVIYEFGKPGHVMIYLIFENDLCWEFVVRSKDRRSLGQVRKFGIVDILLTVGLTRPTGVLRD